MLKIVKIILREFYKIPRYESRIDDGIYGKFRVKYRTDGAISQKMCWHNAKSYAKIFGGDVIDAFN